VSVSTIRLPEKKRIAKDLGWDAKERQRPSENLQRIKKIKGPASRVPSKPCPLKLFSGKFSLGGVRPCKRCHTVTKCRV
jgi:hypothetical protein